MPQFNSPQYETPQNRTPRVVMPKNKLDKKWYGVIWLALIVASLFRNAYAIYSGFLIANFASTAKIVSYVFTEIIFQGALPALLCYLCASVVFSMVWRKNVRFSSRNDFLYITMIFVAVSRLVIGFIEVLCILNPDMYIYTTIILDVAVLSIALLLEFFLVLKPRYMNDKSAYLSFSTFSSIYLVVQGLLTLLPCFGVFILSSGKELLPAEYLKTIETAIGYSLKADSAAVTASIIAIVIFVVVCVVATICRELLRRKSKNYVEPEQPDEVNESNPFGINPNNPNGGNPYNQNGGNPYNQNGGNPFVDFPFEDVVPKDKTDNVFDEFDI